MVRKWMGGLPKCKLTAAAAPNSAATMALLFGSVCMRHLKSLLVVGTALVGLTAPASAQWYGGSSPYNAPPPPYGYGGGSAYGRPLPRDAIVDRLEDRGFDDVGRPRFDGSVYVVEALSRRSGPVRLVVDAFDGRILRESPLAVARIGREDDGGIEIDSDDVPRGRSGFPPAEMPNAPGYRANGPEDLQRREALSPAEPDLAAPRPSGRTRPADPRLAPDMPGAASRAPESQEPRREASRPSGLEAGVPSGVVEGVNPDSRRAAARPAARPSAAARPADTVAPSARTSPSAPAPATAATPEERKPAPGPATAEAGERKVRVIQGVTPLNSGAQSSPAPQNNVGAAPKPDAPAQN